ncbi:unnamed protein product [Calicophoron daubneyi]|uniref:TIR domain-containing protein n=1 Tax=Calicophoron daubneyi TaxID=300641 RepID=A0AAV2TL48_CALDB
MEKTREEHVMISYQHKDKVIAAEIANRLKSAGIKVWIDSDNMSSEIDIVDAMARAIEGAFAVCVLYSQAYKDSENTKREAKYAYQMKKPILFLRAQLNYKPDGWLGFMIGTQLYIDFSGKYPFEQKFEELLQSLKNLQSSKNKSPEPAVVTPPPQPAPPPPQPAPRSRSPSPDYRGPVGQVKRFVGHIRSGRF